MARRLSATTPSLLNSGNLAPRVMRLANADVQSLFRSALIVSSFFCCFSIAASWLDAVCVIGDGKTVVGLVGGAFEKSDLMTLTRTRVPSLRMAMFSVRLTSPRICDSPVGREDGAAESGRTSVKELSTA